MGEESKSVESEVNFDTPFPARAPRAVSACCLHSVSQAAQQTVKSVSRRRSTREEQGRMSMCRTGRIKGRSAHRRVAAEAASVCVEEARVSS